MVRGVRSTIEGAVLLDCGRTRCDCRPLTVKPGIRGIHSRTLGQTCDHVTRLGKRIVLRLQSGDRFVIEPRMTGLFLTSAPPDLEHLRFSWTWKRPQVAEQTVLFWDRRGLGVIQLLSAAQYEQLEQRLGPDPLQMTVAQWRTRLSGTSRPLKVALLDQTVAAGIGNLYASEILHRARLSPERVAKSLTPAELGRLRAAVVEILETAIQYEGSTLGDGTYRNALNQSGGYQNHHRVYDRAEERCLTCGRGIIRRIVQAQRATFYCPQCQKGR